MSAWGSVLGAAGDLANTALGLFQTHKAYRRAKDMYQHRYQWAVDDMRKAGLNPVLAASGGVSTGGLNAGQVGDTGNFGSNAVAAYKASQESDLIKSQIEANQNSAAKDFSLMNLYNDQAGLTRAQEGFLLDTWDYGVKKASAEASSAQSMSVMHGNAAGASNLQFKYMKDNPSLRDAGNAFRLLNPANSASSLLSIFK
jgi:hypothetical protein